MRGHLADEARPTMARERAEQERLRHIEDFVEGSAAVCERRPAHLAGQ
jgi:hypothetical protein